MFRYDTHSKSSLSILLTQTVLRVQDLISVLLSAGLLSPISSGSSMITVILLLSAFLRHWLASFEISVMLNASLLMYSSIGAWIFLASMAVLRYFCVAISTVFSLPSVSSIFSATFFSHASSSSNFRPWIFVFSSPVNVNEQFAVACAVFPLCTAATTVEARTATRIIANFCFRFFNIRW